MSADRQRLVGAIRRMVKSDPDIRDLLGGAKNKGDQAGSGAKAASQGEEERICCDGSTAPPNAGTEERDPDSGGQDASGGLDPDDPANLDMGAGSLTGLTDCSTGEPICFDGSGHIPPDGWDAPNEPPIDPTYTEGMYWSVETGNVIGTGATKSLALADAGARGDCFWCSRNEFYDVVLPGSPVPGGCGDSSVTFVCGGQAYSGGTVADIYQRSCAASGEGLDACDPDPEDLLLDTWPSDGCVNLAIKGGAIVGSKYDPEASGTSYLKSVEELPLCDDFGNSFTIRASGSSPGGWKTIDSTNSDGYLYNAQGEQIARISGDEFSDPTI